MKRVLYAIVLSVASIYISVAQSTAVKIHSHNDYEQAVPFWNAYTYGMQSIEIDLILKNNNLFVAHDFDSIDENRNIESLYLKPLQDAITLNIGKAKGLQFMLDLKSDPEKSLDILIPILKKYTKLIQDNDITFVVSGNKPNLDYFKNTPAYILLDHQKTSKISNMDTWNKVAMISLDFKAYSTWNGKGRLIETEKQKVQDVIDAVHKLGKPIRFWGTPDGKTAWKAFVDMGVDVINTDNPYQARNYIDKLPKNVYKNTMQSTIYYPSFESDNKDVEIKNVILLIGDGNGLTQISAAALANQGQLSVLNLKSIGLIKTQSADDFTTDSAAGGTALATGVKSYNRSIGMSVDRKPLRNIAEIVKVNGYNTACITTDEIVGATPATFYAHQIDRDDAALIANDLVNSSLNLFIGGGKRHFMSTQLENKFNLLQNVNELSQTKSDKVGVFIGEDWVKGIIEGRTDILAQATKKGLQFLKDKNAPFFIMIEGAKIDSYGHFNNTGGIVTEGIDFDKAITEALKFADQDKHTLVLVTADHETSGFAIPQGNVKTGIIEGDFISNDHTGVMVPIFAYGPHSSEFTGVYENNEVFTKIMKVLKIKTK